MRKSLGFAALFCTCLAALTLAPSAAEPHGGAVERHGGFERHEVRGPSPAEHWQFDERFHHDHFYPVPGYPVSVLPPDNVGLTFRGGRYFFHAGVWYQPAGSGFMVVRPPLGIVAPILPPAYATVWAGGVPYYYADDTYYAATPGGYAVVAPPIDPSVAPPPLAAAALAQPQAAPAPAGNWYYCDSAKSYYPYVSQCPEGWRAVPATPPR